MGQPMSNNLTEYGEPQNGQPRANDLDVAWLAGIFDGEGCLAAQWVNGTQEHVALHWRVGNTDSDLLDKVQRIVLSVAGRKYPISLHDDSGVHFCYRIDVTNQRGVELLCQATLPYLTSKREQAEAVIRFCESRRLHRHKNTGYSPEERGLVADMKRLKRCNLVPTNRGVESKRETPTAA